MSEFKFACPVCGQHMVCDTSHGGAVMVCPTCFQKIVAPGAPASDSKFILTGTKLSERPPSTLGADAGGSVAAPVKRFPGAVVVLAIFLFIGVAVGFVYHGTIFKSQPAAPPAKPGGKKVIAVPTPPPASDTNWTLNLDSATTPATPAVGRVHGQSSTLNHVIFQGGVLTFHPSVRGAADVSIAINFGGAQPDALAGKTINVTTNADQAAKVALHWKDNSHNQKETFDNGYALRLEFGVLDKKRLPGKIYFCAPDDLESYVMGTFTAEIRSPKPKK